MLNFRFSFRHVMNALTNITLVASIATVLFRFVVFNVKELLNTIILCYAIIIRHGAFNLLNDFARLNLVILWGFSYL